MSAGLESLARCRAATAHCERGAEALQREREQLRWQNWRTRCAGVWRGRMGDARCRTPPPGACGQPDRWRPDALAVLAEDDAPANGRSTRWRPACPAWPNMTRPGRCCRPDRFGAGGVVRGGVTLRRYADRVDLDPPRLAEVERTWMRSWRVPANIGCNRPVARTAGRLAAAPGRARRIAGPAGRAGRPGWRPPGRLPGAGRKTVGRPPQGSAKYGQAVSGRCANWPVVRAFQVALPEAGGAVHRLEQVGSRIGGLAGNEAKPWPRSPRAASCRASAWPSGC